MQRFIFTAPALTYDPDFEGSSGNFVTDVSMTEIDLRLFIDNGSDLPKPYEETQAPPSALEAALFAQGSSGRVLTGDTPSGPETYTFFFGHVGLETGARAEILTISETGSRTEYVVQIAGDPLDLSTPAEANAVLGSVTSVVSVPSGEISPLLLERPVPPETDGPAPAPGLDREGTAGNDILEGTAEADTMSGLGGDDRLDGGPGDDRLEGGAGADGLLGRGGDDLVRAGSGSDTVAASGGDDTVFGGAGRDMIGGGLGHDLLQGDAGRDTIGGGHGDDEILGGSGDDVLAGGAGRDRLFGDGGSDTIGASYGDDLVYGGAEGDSLGGGSGLDILEGGAGSDTIGGGLGTDTIFGGDGDDFLAGGSGDDSLVGDAGDDTLNAGDGSDALYGGGGRDVFVWTAPDAGARDVIYDFTPGADRIRLAGIESLEDLDLDIPPAVTVIAHETHDGEGLSGQEPDIESAVLAYGGQEIVLQGVQAGELDASQFIFL